MEKTRKFKKLSDWFWDNVFLIISIAWIAKSVLDGADSMNIDCLISACIGSVFLCTDSIIKEIKKGKN